MGMTVGTGKGRRRDRGIGNGVGIVKDTRQDGAWGRPGAASMRSGRLAARLHGATGRRGPCSTPRIDHPGGFHSVKCLIFDARNTADDANGNKEEQRIACVVLL
ncbi:unnamed protein product [Lampetra planeri]